MRESPEIDAEEMSLSDEEDFSDREDHWLPTLVFMCQEHDVTPKAIWVEGAAYQNIIPEFCQAFVDLGKWEYLFDATLNKELNLPHVARQELIKLLFERLTTFPSEFVSNVCNQTHQRLMQIDDPYILQAYIAVFKGFQAQCNNYARMNFALQRFNSEGLLSQWAHQLATSTLVSIVTKDSPRNAELDKLPLLSRRQQVEGFLRKRKPGFK